MPTSVRYSERLTYAAMAIIFINQMVNWDRTSRHLADSPLAFILLQIAFLCIQIFWVWLVVRKRTNWARWMTLAAQFGMMFVIGFSLGFIALKGNPEGTALELVFLIVSTSFYLLAACLLFTRDAAPWFIPQRV